MSASSSDRKTPRLQVVWKRIRTFFIVEEAAVNTATNRKEFISMLKNETRKTESHIESHIVLAERRR